MRTRNCFLLCLALLLCLAVAPPTTAQSTPSLGFAPTSLSLAVAGTGTIDLQLQNAQDLASYELELRFDPAVVVVERVERLMGTDAQPTPGRTWLSLPMDGGGQSTFIEHAPGHIAFGAYSFGDGNPTGPGGDLKLVRLHVRGATAGLSALTIPQALVTDSHALPTTPTATAGSVIVGTAAYSLFLPYVIAAAPAPNAP